MPRSKTILYAALQYMFVFFGLIENIALLRKKASANPAEKIAFRDLW